MPGNPHKVINKFFSRNSADQKAVTWYILKDERGNLQSRILYPTRLSLRFDREIKTFTDKQQLTEFSTTKLSLKDAKGTPLGRKDHN